MGDSTDRSYVSGQGRPVPERDVEPFWPPDETIRDLSDQAAAPAPAEAPTAAAAPMPPQSAPPADPEAWRPALFGAGMVAGRPVNAVPVEQPENDWAPGPGRGQSPPNATRPVDTWIVDGGQNGTEWAPAAPVTASPTARPTPPPPAVDLDQPFSLDQPMDTAVPGEPTHTADPNQQMSNLASGGPMQSVGQDGLAPRESTDTVEPARSDARRVERAGLDGPEFDQEADTLVGALGPGPIPVSRPAALNGPPALSRQAPLAAPPTVTGVAAAGVPPVIRPAPDDQAPSQRGPSTEAATGRVAGQRPVPPISPWAQPPQRSTAESGRTAEQLAPIPRQPVIESPPVQPVPDLDDDDEYADEYAGQGVGGYAGPGGGEYAGPDSGPVAAGRAVVPGAGHPPAPSVPAGPGTVPSLGGPPVRPELVAQPFADLVQPLGTPMGPAPLGTLMGPAPSNAPVDQAPPGPPGSQVADGQAPGGRTTGQVAGAEAPGGGATGQAPGGGAVGAASSGGAVVGEAGGWPPSAAAQVARPGVDGSQPPPWHQVASPRQSHPGVTEVPQGPHQESAGVTRVPPPVTAGYPDPFWTPDRPAPTAEDFARRRQVRPMDPVATMGVRAVVNKSTLGLVKLAPGRHEQEFKRDIEMVRRNFGGLRQVTVVNPKGGAGKTVAILLLAMTFGQKRGGYVLAWDNNETQGTLGMRAQQDFHARTVRDMLRDLGQFQGAHGRVGDLSQYVRSQGEGMFDVLASDESATGGEMLTASAFAEIREVVSRFYKLIFVDTGNNVRAQNWQAAMDATDQLVVTMSARNDSAETAARMLDHLEQSGRHRLVRQAVTVVSMPPSRKEIDLPAIQQHFAARTRAVLLAPYERLIDSGEPIRYGQLSSASREAWLKIAAAVAEGL